MIAQSARRCRLTLGKFRTCQFCGKLRSTDLHVRARLALASGFAMVMRVVIMGMMIMIVVLMRRAGRISPAFRLERRVNTGDFSAKRLDQSGERILAPEP